VGEKGALVMEHVRFTAALEEHVRGIVRDEMQRELARREMESRPSLADTADEGADGGE
jgi:hypothetical protein